LSWLLVETLHAVTAANEAAEAAISQRFMRMAAPLAARARATQPPRHRLALSAALI
jgi:hypothetical protein